ncbi:ATP-binding protein [Streptomyces anandii]|uniref:ATP-binding protein n=1 Tax=Streptomyces anandii TaxID=285454 RepID=UPI0016797B1B|nr:ATP-binding protein [Streptomyces anandii]GGY12034.1 ATPase [Streptomyces anandii JCM 4720]
MNALPLTTSRPAACPTVFSWRVPLRSGPDAAGSARRAVQQAVSSMELSTAGDVTQDGVADTVVLVVSELVTNAWRHGGGGRELRLCWDGWWLTVEVDDRSPVQPSPRPEADRGERGGYGLGLVDALADSWGCVPGPHGKTVYAGFHTSPRRADPDLGSARSLPAVP